MIKTYLKFGVAVLLSFLTEKVSAEVVPSFLEDAFKDAQLGASKITADGTKILGLIQKAKDQDAKIKNLQNKVNTMLASFNSTTSLAESTETDLQTLADELRDQDTGLTALSNSIKEVESAVSQAG